MCPGAGGVAKAEKPAPALRPAFDVLDADRDGKISSHDLRSSYETFSLADEDVIDSMISAADSDRNGFVEYEEFERVLRPKRSENRGYAYEVVEEASKVMDGDGDGNVCCDDLRRCLKIAGVGGERGGDFDDVRLGGGDDHGLREILGFDDN